MEIYLRYAANTTNLPNHFFTKAYDCRMLFILEGEGEISLGNKTFSLKENDLCYYPAGERYFPKSSSKHVLRFITLNFDFDKKHPHLLDYSTTVKEENFCSKRALMTHRGDVPELFGEYFLISDLYALRNTFLEIEKEFNSGDRYAKEMAATKLQYLCYSLQKTRPKANHKLFDKTVRYIHENLFEIESNDQIAKALNYHSYYLNKIFKAQTGVSMHQYILMKRLEKAVFLLHNTNFSIAEIAKECGFENQRYFSSSFSKRYGRTASQVRKEKMRLL